MARRIVLSIVFLLAVASIAFAQKQRPLNDDEKAAAVSGMGVCGVVGLIILIGSFVLAEIMPIAIAIYRSHPDTLAIVIITVFFGWTCIGWWIALIWAVKAFPKQSTVNVNVGGNTSRGDNSNPFDFQ